MRDSRASLRARAAGASKVPVQVTLKPGAHTSFHGADARTAIESGFRHSAKVVTTAALIMISVFAGFVGSHDAMLKSMGFGLAIAVFFDAFIVRMTIVPAVLALLGKRAWSLPGWIDRILPNVDIKGEKLTQRAPDKQHKDEDKLPQYSSSH